MPSTSAYKGKLQQQQTQQTGKYGSNTSNSNAPETKVSKNQQINSKPHTPIYHVYGDHNQSTEINESKSTKPILSFDLDDHYSNVHDQLGNYLVVNLYVLTHLFIGLLRHSL